MTATEEPTLYDVLEVDPASSLDELRAAVDRARETFGTESLAVYALVDEDQLGELRARLDAAAEVLLTRARRCRRSSRGHTRARRASRSRTRTRPTTPRRRTTSRRRARRGSRRSRSR
jgi:hypothetical protein